MSALDRQEGGNHYKDRSIQPVQYIHSNGLNYFEGSVVKYVTRWRLKGGLEDLRKARHYLDLLIELEQAAEKPVLLKPAPAPSPAFIETKGAAPWLFVNPDVPAGASGLFAGKR